LDLAEDCPSFIPVKEIYIPCISSDNEEGEIRVRHHVSAATKQASIKRTYSGSGSTSSGGTSKCPVLFKEPKEDPRKAVLRQKYEMIESFPDMDALMIHRQMKMYGAY
jgi:hypothetical protein